MNAEARARREGVAAALFSRPHFRSLDGIRASGGAASLDGAISLFTA